MDKVYIKISIRGPRNSGKTTVLNKLKAFLEKENCTDLKVVDGVLGSLTANWEKSL